MEVELTWLRVSGVPPLGEGTEIRQGYLAVDGEVEVRVRAAGGLCVLTVKGGSGLRRTEVELPLSSDQLEELWPLTEGRRVGKVRHRVPLSGGLTAEVDVFAGHLEGLRVVEVEFPDDEALDAFEPPDWFGDDVTDDGRYSNARLAVAEGPPAPASGS